MIERDFKSHIHLTKLPEAAEVGERCQKGLPYTQVSPYLLGQNTCQATEKASVHPAKSLRDQV